MSSWSEYGEVVAVPNPTPPPDELPPEQKATGEPFYRGAVDVTIQGTGQQLLADTWFATRYYYPGVCGNPDPSQDAANFSTWTRPQLYEGWVKRVMKNVNLFDQKVKDFHASEVNTLSSMISLAGRRYEGDVPLNDDPAYLHGVGLIELYETLLRRALGLTIDAGPDEHVPQQGRPAGGQPHRRPLPAPRQRGLRRRRRPDDRLRHRRRRVRHARRRRSSPSRTRSTRCSRRSWRCCAAATTRRGRAPFYNRLVWNFTIGDGEVAYRRTTTSPTRTADGEINEDDAMILYPQGHGDAWGHYLTA